MTICTVDTLQVARVPHVQRCQYDRHCSLPVQSHHLHPLMGWAPVSTLKLSSCVKTQAACTFNSCWASMQPALHLAACNIPACTPSAVCSSSVVLANPQSSCAKQNSSSVQQLEVVSRRYLWQYLVTSSGSEDHRAYRMTVVSVGISLGNSTCLTLMKLIMLEVQPDCFKRLLWRCLQFAQALSLQPDRLQLRRHMLWRQSVAVVRLTKACVM